MIRARNGLLIVVALLLIYVAVMSNLQTTSKTTTTKVERPVFEAPFSVQAIVPTTSVCTTGMLLTCTSLEQIVDARLDAWHERHTEAK